MAKRYVTRFTLSLAVLAVTILLQAAPALAACTTHTIFTSDGRVVMCTVCCTGSSCTTTCF